MFERFRRTPRNDQGGDVAVQERDAPPADETARDLLRTHGTLDALIAAAGDVRSDLRPRVRAALTDGRDALHAYREIATLRHVDVARPPDGQTDWPAAARAARERGMNRLAERLAAHAA